MTLPSRFLWLKELRRRRVFRVAGLYVIGVWLVMQVADIVFPAWGIPDAAIRYLLWAGLAGFPIALAFGWIFDVTAAGIRRTQPAASEAELLQSLPLRRTDYLLLAAFLAVGGIIVFGAANRVMDTAMLQEIGPVAREIDPDSLAVLPFANLSSDPEHEYFADGISEEILNRLAEFRELKVIARTSSFVFKDSGFDIARISEMLGVHYLLQGSVRRDGDQLRISAQLVEHSGVQVWSSNFDREVGSMFALQDEIAEAVASSILPEIRPPAQQARAPDLDAWQHFVAGREIMARRATMWFRDASEEFGRAIELDPEFAAAYAARAASLVIGARWLAGDYEVHLDLARQDIEQALALDPTNARAYAAQALLEQVRNPADLASQEALLRRALSLDPNLVDALNWLAGVVDSQGRHAEAEDLLHRAARIDPLAPVINANLSQHELAHGRAADAERRLLRLLEVPQPSAVIMLMHCQLLLETARLAESLQCGKRRVMFGSPSRGRAFSTQLMILPYGLLGMREQAEYWMARTEREWPELYHVNLWRATMLGHATGQLGYEEALASFERVLGTAGVAPDELDPESALVRGILLAFAGRHRDGVRVLESVRDPEKIESIIRVPGGVDASLALAWLYQELGVPAKGETMLKLVSEHFSALQAAGRLHGSTALVEYALNTLLRGELEAALGLLERAEAAGWRGYYAALQDPRWDSARDEPRFKAVMARVKADLDAQRAQVEATEAEDDFVARLDAAIAQDDASQQQ